MRYHIKPLLQICKVCHDPAFACRSETPAQTCRANDCQSNSMLTLCTVAELASSDDLMRHSAALWSLISQQVCILRQTLLGKVLVPEGLQGLLCSIYHEYCNQIVNIDSSCQERNKVQEQLCTQTLLACFSLCLHTLETRGHAAACWCAALSVILTA